MSGLRTAAALGGLVFLLGLFVAPSRAWGGYLMGFVFFVGMASGGWALRVSLDPPRRAVGHGPATDSRGHDDGLAGRGRDRRRPRRRRSLASTSGLTRASSLDDPILLAKSGYLNTGFFLLRLIAFFALWIWLTRGMVATSRAQDADGDPVQSKRRWKWAALFLPVFAITFSLASVDWLESLEPHWFSTIYALGTLAGLGTSGLAVCIMLAVFLRRGPLRGVMREDHLDDLGKIAVAIALFWGYIWYCQYMLIWYTDMPEETPYYVLRSQGGWKILSSVNVLANWAVPFFALMPKRARRSETMLLRVAWVMLAGQVLNLYVLVAPTLLPEGPVIGPWELGPIVGAFCLFLLLTLRGLSQAPLVPERDPLLSESLQHRC